MADFRSRIQKLSPERLALLALELQSRLEKLERQRTEPIAIIGMGCRIPGADSGPEAFWQLLEEGRDAISEIPPERWDAAAYYDPGGDVPGRMATKWGGSHDLAQPLDEIGQLLGLGLVRHRLAQRLVGVGQVAQHQPLGARQPVERHVLGEGQRPLVHVPHHRLGRKRIIQDPRMPAPVDVIRAVQHVGQRLGDRSRRATIQVPGTQ